MSQQDDNAKNYRGDNAGQTDIQLVPENQRNEKRQAGMPGEKQRAGKIKIAQDILRRYNYGGRKRTDMGQDGKQRADEDEQRDGFYRKQDFAGHGQTDHENKNDKCRGAVNKNAVDIIDADMV